MNAMLRPTLVTAVLATLAGPAVLSAAAASAAAPAPIFGQSAKALPGDVMKYSWPRRDLHVAIGSTKIAPALALGSWAAIHGTGSQAMAMGDLVLIDSEVNPVIRELQAGGFEILAVHNHLLGESPHVLYVHFMGHGEEAALGRTLAGALEKTRTPRESAASATPSADETKVFDAFQTALGHKGSMAGTVLQVGVPRADPITDGGMEIPPSMGMAESINAEVSDGQVAATGDFVLVADEVNPVIRELQAHGIEVTALHSHMLRENPRLFFMHFWGAGAPEKVGEGLKAALSKIAIRQ
jgi:biotin operon repressor